MFKALSSFRNQLFLIIICRNKKNYLHAAKFARFAYNIDPKLFRRKFLAFRLASTFDYLESYSLLKTFKLPTLEIAIALLIIHNGTAFINPSLYVESKK